MSYQVFREFDFKTSIWSGGQTKELFISPRNALVADRAFEFRISTATVEVENSIFSDFSGYNRIICSLNSNFYLKHSDVEYLCLPPFEFHSFSGSVKTESKGIFSDFNIIYKPEWIVQVESKEGDICFISSDFKHSFLYVVQGEILFLDSKLTSNTLLHFESDFGEVKIHSKSPGTKYICIHFKN